MPLLIERTAALPKRRESLSGDWTCDSVRCGRHEQSSDGEAEYRAGGATKDALAEQLREKRRTRPRSRRSADSRAVSVRLCGANQSAIRICSAPLPTVDAAPQSVQRCSAASSVVAVPCPVRHSPFLERPNSRLYWDPSVSHLQRCSSPLWRAGGGVCCGAPSQPSPPCPATSVSPHRPPQRRRSLLARSTLLYPSLPLFSRHTPLSSHPFPTARSTTRAASAAWGPAPTRSRAARGRCRPRSDAPPCARS